MQPSIEVMFNFIFQSVSSVFPNPTLSSVCHKTAQRVRIVHVHSSLETWAATLTNVSVPVAMSPSVQPLLSSPQWLKMLPCVDSEDGAMVVASGMMSVPTRRM